jgi:hypothetical protein
MYDLGCDSAYVIYFVFVAAQLPLEYLNFHQVSDYSGIFACCAASHCACFDSENPLVSFELL